MANTSQIQFKGTQAFSNESKYSARIGNYRGRTGILVSKRLVPFIEDYGVLLSNRDQYITLRFSVNLTISLTNLYGYNQLTVHANMWHSLARCNLPETEWIWGED